MSVDTRSRAQWREAFEQCQAHARKMRRELERARAEAWAEGVRWAFNEADADADPDDHNPYRQSLSSTSGQEANHG